MGLADSARVPRLSRSRGRVPSRPEAGWGVAADARPRLRACRRFAKREVTRAASTRVRAVVALVAAAKGTIGSLPLHRH